MCLCVWVSVRVCSHADADKGQKKALGSMEMG